MGIRTRRLLPKVDGVVDVKGLDCSIKFAAAKAFPSVVGILCRRLPHDMACFMRGNRVHSRLSKGEIKRRGELVFWGSGIIYECDRVDDYFTSIIICPAILFVRSNGLDPSDIEVDVCLWDGKLCQGRVIACDFHYNLAAIRIHTLCQLPTAILRDLDDVVPLNLTLIQQEQQQQLPYNYVRQRIGLQRASLGQGRQASREERGSCHQLSRRSYWTHVL